jgi:hypothetical protein
LARQSGFVPGGKYALPGKSQGRWAGSVAGADSLEVTEALESIAM